MSTAKALLRWMNLSFVLQSSLLADFFGRKSVVVIDFGVDVMLQHIPYTVHAVNAVA